MAKEKKKKDPSGLTGEDILISVLIAVAIGIVFFIAVLIIGSAITSGSARRSSSDSPAVASQPVASQPVRGTLPSQAPTQTTPLQEAPAATAPTPEPEPAATPAQAPVSDQGSGTVSNSDGTFTHDFSGGRVLATTGSDNSGDPVYHTGDCRAAKTISPENVYWYASEQDAKNDGRRLCGYCD